MKLTKTDNFLLATLCGLLILTILAVHANVIAFQLIYCGFGKGEWTSFNLTAENFSGYWRWSVGKILVIANISLLVMTVTVFLLMWLIDRPGGWPRSAR